MNTKTKTLPRYDREIIRALSDSIFGADLGEVREEAIEAIVEMAKKGQLTKSERLILKYLVAAVASATVVEVLEDSLKNLTAPRSLDSSVKRVGFVIRGDQHVFST